MRKAILGSVLLAMSIAYTGCSSGGDGDGGGGSGGSGAAAPLSFDAETSLPATGGAAAAIEFAAQFGTAIESILGALANAPAAAPLAVTRKINVSGFFCPGGGLADLTGAVVTGEEVKLVLNDCVGSAFGAGSVSGEITLTINEGTNFDIFNGGPIYATAVVDLTISPGGTLVGEFDAFAEASAGLAMINLRLGNQLDSDILTWSEGGQVLELGCFDILQRIQSPSGFVMPLGVANLYGQIYTINDYAASTNPTISFDSNGVPSSGEMTLLSGDRSVEGADRNGRPCAPFAETPAGDNTYVDVLFSEGGCISLSGVDKNDGPFETSTSWDKLLDRDFTAGGGQACDGGGTGGTGGSMTAAMPGPETCDSGNDIFPVADTFIQGDGPEGKNSDRNFGASASLLIKSVNNLYFTRKMYLRFELSDVPETFDKASLVLTLDFHPGLGPQPVNVYGITAEPDWDPDILTEIDIDERDAINWENAPRNENTWVAGMQFDRSDGEVPLLIPGYDFDLGGDDLQDDPGTKYALDITEYVTGRQMAGTDGMTILMAVYNPLGLNEDGSVFFSKEYEEECDRPFLHFE